MDGEPTEIYDLLYSLGTTVNHTGFFHTALAVRPRPAEFIGMPATHLRPAEVVGCGRVMK